MYGVDTSLPTTALSRTKSTWATPDAAEAVASSVSVRKIVADGAGDVSDVVGASGIAGVVVPAVVDCALAFPTASVARTA